MLKKREFVDTIKFLNEFGEDFVNYGAYAAGTNSLVPLYSYATSWRVFVCPSTTDAISNTASGLAIATGGTNSMSYRYISGLTQADDADCGLIWGATPANHDNDGINCVYIGGDAAWCPWRTAETTTKKQ